MGLKSRLLPVTLTAFGIARQLNCKHILNSRYGCRTLYLLPPFAISGRFILGQESNGNFQTQQRCRLSSASSNGDDGQWLSDIYPDMSLISEHPEIMVESLVQRIHVKSVKEAEGLVFELAEALKSYKQAKVELVQLREAMSSMRQNRNQSNITTSQQMGGNTLEYFELKDSEKTAKSNLIDTYNTFIELYRRIPNIITDLRMPASPSPLKPCILKAPSLGDSNASDMFKQNNVGVNYVIGQKALLELELTNFTADYLESLNFIPITCPSFLHEDMYELAGLRSGAVPDMFALQTKLEIHESRHIEHSREFLDERKPKVEDNWVYQACGLTELSLAGFFLRMDCKTSTYHIYAIGNRYHLPYSGKPVQSRVALLMTTTSSMQSAVLSYEYNVNAIQMFWKTLDIGYTMRQVKHHDLQFHEACAIEFLIDDSRFDTKIPLVLSRVSTSYDFLSRRIMAYSREQNYKCSYFCAGEVTDITALLQTLSTV